MAAKLRQHVKNTWLALQNPSFLSYPRICLVHPILHHFPKMLCAKNNYLIDFAYSFPQAFAIYVKLLSSPTLQYIPTTQLFWNTNFHKSISMPSFFSLNLLKLFVHNLTNVPKPFLFTHFKHMSRGVSIIYFQHKIVSF